MLGYYRYYGITDNGYKLKEFHNHVLWTLFKGLNRRSQRKSFDGEKFKKFLDKFPHPQPKIYVGIMEFRMSPPYLYE